MRVQGVKATAMTGTSADEPLLTQGQPFETFYAHQHPALVSLAYSVSGSWLAAEDLAQETLVIAYKDWDRIRRRENPEAWVRRILLNRSVSAYRRRLSEMKALARFAARETVVYPELPGDMERIWIEIRRLPKRQIQVIALRYAEQRTMSEIAAILGCSKESVNTHIRRARATLARRLHLEEES